MGTIVTVLSAVCGVYGFFWILFIFIDPPSYVSHLFRSPAALYFIPEKMGRFLIGAVLLFVIPLFAQVIVSSIMK